MNPPYIICHMVTSLDGKATGSFLSTRECERSTDLCYQHNNTLWLNYRRNH